MKAAPHFATLIQTGKVRFETGVSQERVKELKEAHVAAKMNR